MNPTRTARVATRQPVRHARDPDAIQLRLVGLRLAALMVALLSVLLLVLGAVAYVRTQDALLQPIRQAIQIRANGELRHVFDLSKEGGHEPLTEQEAAGVFITFVNRRMVVLGGSPSPFGNATPDRRAAEAAQDARVAIFSTRIHAGQQYMLYSKPVLHNGRAVGAVQTGMSEQQYRESLQALLQILLIVGGIGLVASGGITGLVVSRALLPIRQALRRQRDFVADAAHELRTPLTIMRSTAEVGLANGTEDEQQRAEQSLVQSNHLTHLVDDLSLLARADSGVLDLERSPLDLSRLTVETISGVEILAEEQGVRVEVDLPDELRMLGDAGRLRQLLLILLDNAVKYTPEGGDIEVSVERRRSRAQLRVHDSGPGIDAHDLPNLFDRFYQADRARGVAGSGLGLAIGRRIAEAHGGHLSAMNAPDGGAIFTISLPLA